MNSITTERMTDKELFEKLDQVGTDFHGQADDLNEVVGLFVMGRLYGWRVERIVCSNRIWRLATKLVGDPKKILPERGPLAHKSFALKAINTVGDYWELVSGRSSRDAIPLHDRKMIS